MLLSKCTAQSLKLRELQTGRYFGCLLLKVFASKYSTANLSRVRSTAAMGTTENPIVKIAQGLIRGAKQKTIYGHDYYGFEGIPYGQPPVGELRFKSPLPALSWNEVKDCLEFAGKPMQKNFQGEIEGSEDCLYLNVYAKKLNANEKLPVLVYIYGGGFNTGSCGKYRPDYFMQEDVLLVTFNYRLSVLGFLSLNDPSLQVPGNAGLKDQVLALKWVRDNIAHFGGDDKNITLFGESAGAASVHYMLCTEQAKGLCHKAILMSGCILNNWAFTADTTDLPYRLACENGYTGKREDYSVLEFLKSCPADKLLNMDKLNAEAWSTGTFFTFVPSLEPYDNDEAVIRKPLLESMKFAWGNAIPLMIGGTSFEGLVRYPFIKHNPGLLDKYKEAPETLIPPEVLCGKSEADRAKFIQAIRELYMKDVESHDKKWLMNYLEYCSMRGFWHGLHRVIKSRQLLATAPTYQYCFDVDSPTFNHHRKIFCGSDIQQGVAHADDLAYIFYTSYSWKLDETSMEFSTIQRMIEMWTQFAKTSNPNCVYTKDSEWRTVSETNVHKWQHISDDLQFEDMPKELKDKIDVWNSFYGDALL